MIDCGLVAVPTRDVLASPALLRRMVTALEASPLESLWAVEHAVIPRDYSSTYPYAADGRMSLSTVDAVPDPLEWLAFVAGCTERLRLGTAMLILPEHNPVRLAKRLATLDALSAGRLEVGVGVGWLREEYEALGVSFAGRGERADEYLEAIRRLWQGGPVSFSGKHTSFSGVVSRPRPVQPDGPPVVIGGSSPPAARRAGRYGDGFFPLGVSPDRLAELLEIAREEREAAGRAGEELKVTVNATFDPAKARAFVDLGVSRFMLGWTDPTDVDATVELVRRFSSEVLDEL